MKNLDKLADKSTTYLDPSEQFRVERLQGHQEDEWAARIDRAVLDILFGVAIGSSNKPGDRGGTIGKMDFGNATGQHYANGLTAIADHQSDLPRLINEYGEKNGLSSFGDLVFYLNELRYELNQHLSEEDEIRNIDRAVEALIDKIATTSISEGVTRQALQRPESVTDTMIQLFSDPAVTEYADALTTTMHDIAEDESFLKYLDAPHMTTPLWGHQQDALKKWVEHSCKGYINMATATGKTVLGLAAIGLLYGKLHPSDSHELGVELEDTVEQIRSNSARILIVAGQDLILEQWQSEFDEHLNIPRERTQVADNCMKFTWGTIEFQTAQGLLQMETVGGYDLVILDEAHRYTRGSLSGGWQTVLKKLSKESSAILAMSGSIDTSWHGDSTVKRVLEEQLQECMRFSVDEARKTGVVADFSWDIYYAHAEESEAQESLVSSTTLLQSVYDTEDHKFCVDKLEGEQPENIPKTVETLTDLRSFSQSKAGVKARDSSPEFDQLATDAFTRRPKRWQLFPPTQTLVELIDRHAPDQQCVVLVQSYAQAERISDALVKRYGEELVLVPNTSTSEQFDQISVFKKKDSGIIIGPAEVLGTGIDLPNAEVAINISKGGVNASLIQRIGRVLRNPSGDKNATFYQIVTIPSDPAGLLPGEDGHRLLRRASEFRGLGARLRQLPGYDVADKETAETLWLLEHEGANALSKDERDLGDIVGDEVAQAFLKELQQLCTDPDHTMSSHEPVLTTYSGSAMDRQTQPVAQALKRDKLLSASEDATVDQKSRCEASTDSEELIKATASSSSMEGNTIKIEVSPPLNYLIEREIDEDESVDEFADLIIGDYIGSQIGGTTASTVTNSTVTVELPTHLEQVIRENISDSDGDSIEDYTLDAIYTKLGLEQTTVTRTITLGNGLYQIMESLAEASDTDQSVEDLVTNAIDSYFSDI